MVDLADIMNGKQKRQESPKQRKLSKDDIVALAMHVEAWEKNKHTFKGSVEGFDFELCNFKKDYVLKIFSEGEELGHLMGKHKGFQELYSHASTTIINKHIDSIDKILKKTPVKIRDPISLEMAVEYCKRFDSWTADPDGNAHSYVCKPEEGPVMEVMKYKRGGRYGKKGDYVIKLFKPGTWSWAGRGNLYQHVGKEEILKNFFDSVIPGIFNGEAIDAINTALKRRKVRFTKPLSLELITEYVKKLDKWEKTDWNNGIMYLSKNPRGPQVEIQEYCTKGKFGKKGDCMVKLWEQGSWEFATKGNLFHYVGKDPVAKELSEKIVPTLYAGPL